MKTQVVFLEFSNSVISVALAKFHFISSDVKLIRKKLYLITRNIYPKKCLNLGLGNYQITSIKIIFMHFFQLEYINLRNLKIKIKKNCILNSICKNNVYDI